MLNELWHAPMATETPTQQVFSRPECCLSQADGPIYCVFSVTLSLNNYRMRWTPQEGGGVTFVMKLASSRSPMLLSKGPSSLAGTRAKSGVSTALWVPAAAPAGELGAAAERVSRRDGDLTQRVEHCAWACEDLWLSALAPRRLLFLSCKQFDVSEIECSIGQDFFSKEHNEWSSSEESSAFFHACCSIVSLPFCLADQCT